VQVVANFVAELHIPPEPQPPLPPQLPPPPPPGSSGPPPLECAGLLPQNPIGDGIEVPLPNNQCYPHGTTDDVDGNFALVHGVDMPNGGTFPALRLFTVHDGRAVQVGTTVFGGDSGAFRVWSQPSGFTIFATNEVSASRDLLTYSHDGALVRAERITRMETYSMNSSAIAGTDPSGGTAIVRRDPRSRAVTVTYQRYGKDGAPEGPQVDVGTSDDLFRVGVSLSGDVLVVVGDAQRSLSARWFSRTGAPLTAWFAAALPSLERFPHGDDGPAEAFGSEFKFLVDGSLLLSDRSGAHFVYPDAQPRVDAAPQWLHERPLATVYVSRGGRAYGVARSPQCSGGFEILTTSGTSCGCVDGPDLADPQGAPTPNVFVGRDGSLIVQRHDGPKCGLGYRLYPGLLR